MEQGVRNHIFQRVACETDDEETDDEECDDEEKRDDSGKPSEDMKSLSRQFDLCTQFVKKVSGDRDRKKWFKRLESITSEQVNLAAIKLAYTSAMITIFQVKPKGKESIDMRMVQFLVESVQEFSISVVCQRMGIYALSPLFLKL